MLRGIVFFFMFMVGIMLICGFAHDLLTNLVGVDSIANSSDSRSRYALIILATFLAMGGPGVGILGGFVAKHNMMRGILIGLAGVALAFFSGLLTKVSQTSDFENGHLNKVNIEEKRASKTKRRDQLQSEMDGCIKSTWCDSQEKQKLVDKLDGEIDSLPPPKASAKELTSEQDRQLILYLRSYGLQIIMAIISSTWMFALLSHKKWLLGIDEKGDKVDSKPVSSNVHPIPVKPKPVKDKRRLRDFFRKKKQPKPVKRTGSDEPVKPVQVHENQYPGTGLSEPDRSSEPVQGTGHESIDQYRLAVQLVQTGQANPSTKGLQDAGIKGGRQTIQSYLRRMKNEGVLEGGDKNGQRYRVAKNSKRSLSIVG